MSSISDNPINPYSPKDSPKIDKTTKPTNKKEISPEQQKIAIDRINEPSEASKIKLTKLETSDTKKITVKKGSFFEISPKYEKNTIEEKNKILDSCQQSYKDALSEYHKVFEDVIKETPPQDCYEEKINEQTEIRLKASGKKLPAFYLSEAHQISVAQTLGIFSPAEKAPLLKTLNEAVEDGRKFVELPDIPPDVMNTPVLKDLQNQILTLEECYRNVEGLKKTPNHKPILSEINSKLNEIANEKENLIKNLMTNLQEQLDGIKLSTVKPENLKGIKVSPQLIKMNHKMRQLEAVFLALEPFMEENKAPGYLFKDSEIKQKIINERKAIANEYNALVKEKIAYVKTEYSDNPVYAMGVPQILPTGTELFAVGGETKIDRILLNSGFESPHDFATGFSPKYKVFGQFGMNEMGEVGLYFSASSPTYAGFYKELIETTVEINGKPENTKKINEVQYNRAIKSTLTSNLSGISINAVTELDSFGFTHADIEKGYKELQRNYSFLQHAGLSDAARSEVVILRTENKLKPQAILKIDNSEIEELTLSDYYPKGYTLHQSWTATPPDLTLRTGQEPKGTPISKEPAAGEIKQ